MRAIILKGPGDVMNLETVHIPMPVISEHDVIVRTRAIGINPVDIKTRKGKGLYTALKDFDPLIPGWDISGTVIATGSGTTLFRDGDEVFGMVNFPGHGKAYAEYVAAPESHLALKPEAITHEEAAAASLAALTAWQVMKYGYAVKPGDKVLIHSAAGGVGHYAVQMAKYLGAWVAGTASSLNRDFVLGLGADMHIDYENEKFEEHLKDLDFVLDTIGGEYSERSFRALRPGGTIICIPSGMSDDIVQRAKDKGLIGAHFRVSSNGNDMKEIAGLLEKGIVRSIVSKTFSFDQIRDAHLQIETGRTRGKVVLTLPR
jgi:NADPH:quinone reductase-like Zn-dependent oxidoreductase